MEKPKNTCLIIALCVLSMLVAGCPVPEGGGGFPVERVSVSNSGIQGNAGSFGASMSGDGRYVAFASDATNLVSNDTNSVTDVFVYDRQTDTIERVSVNSGGVQGDGISDFPSISADGRYVAFQSDATNLVPSDTNGSGDIFVRDRTLNTTERVSVSSSGTQGDDFSNFPPSISGAGRYVAFISLASNLVSGDTNGGYDVFVHDRQTGATERVSVSSTVAQGNNESVYCSISADGQYVAFTSIASNLVTGDTNGARDIFVHDRTAHTTERVSVDSSGAQATGSAAQPPSISEDGRYVAFQSGASNLTSNDTNGVQDIFVHDRQTGVTERVSVSSGGVQADAACEYSSLSADGRFVAFSSPATNLVSGDTGGFDDVFVFDRQSDTITRVSLNSAGVQGNSSSYYAAISADGRCVAFPSAASNLVSGDTNAAGDVFAVSFR